MLIFLPLIFAVTPTDIVKATNTYRLSKNKKTLKEDKALMDAAKSHANYMARIRVLTHTGPATKKTVKDRAQRYNYDNMKSIAENVAERGDYSVKNLMNAWKNSKGHNANLLGNYDDIGVGIKETSTGRKYYAQVFGSKFKGVNKI